jgi:hypothetical protein
VITRLIRKWKRKILLNRTTRRARGVKRTSDNKIAEVSTSKKKRAKKPPAESPEPAQAQINFNDQEEQSEENVKRSRMFKVVNDVAEGDISVEELTVALNNAVRSRHLRQLAQGAYHNVPEETRVIELNMEAFNRSAFAIIARNRERAAAYMRLYARPLKTSGINNDISSSSSVEGLVPPSPIAEPQLLASTPHLSAMTPRCAPEPPASEFTTAGAYSMLQSCTTLTSVAQPTHGQRQAAHDPPPPASLPSPSTGSLGVFRTTFNLSFSSTPTITLPLMQSRILDVAARARSASHLADWQRDGDIVIGWIDKLKAQGRDTAPGALGASLYVQWSK